VVIPVENTSTTLTSPAIYERFSLPQIQDYARILHRHGKKIVLHMCGLLRSLLPIFRRMDIDGINAVTPPTVGNTRFEDVLDALGEDFPILGGCFNSNVFQKPGVTRDEVHRALAALYTPRIRRANLLLWPPADGLPTPLMNFLAVREWMEKNGGH
jgi:uroporphyrinogen-III decarboxylase